LISATIEVQIYLVETASVFITALDANLGLYGAYLAMVSMLNGGRRHADKGTGVVMHATAQGGMLSMAAAGTVDAV
jgi:hypothetical protein